LRTGPGRQPGLSQAKRTVQSRVPILFALNKNLQDARIQHTPRTAPEAHREVSPPRTGVPGLRRLLRNLGRAAVGSNQKGTERQRRDTYPNTYFGSNSTPCFFNNATNSSSKVIFLWCRSWFWIYRMTAGIIDLLTLNDP
jgi:hypothetical protein